MTIKLEKLVYEIFYIMARVTIQLHDHYTHSTTPAVLAVLCVQSRHVKSYILGSLSVNLLSLVARSAGDGGERRSC